MVEEEEDEEEEVIHHRGGGASHPASRASINAPSHLLEGGEERAGGDDDREVIAHQRQSGSGMVNTRIADRQTEYQARQRNQMVRVLNVCVRGWGGGEHSQVSRHGLNVLYSVAGQVNPQERDGVVFGLPLLLCPDWILFLPWLGYLLYRELQ